jgi:antitoxin component YwqK of YwqJK toxin-antitoxin module
MKSSKSIYFTIIFFVFLLISCRSEEKPEGVPEGALYNRKTNLYSLTEGQVQYQYYKDGKLYSRCLISESQKRNGLCESFLHSTGTRISWGNFQNGQRDGEWVWTFEDGTPYVVQEFTYGKKKSFWIPVEEWGNDDGQYVRYYYDGKVEEKGYYDSGIKTGDWIKYFPDQKLEYKGSYLNGSKVGLWQYFYPNGSKEAIEKYSQDGKFISRITYYPNGNLWCSSQSNHQWKCKEP